MNLTQALPDFCAELEQALLAAGRGELAAQVRGVDLERYTYDASTGAAYLYVRSPRSRNAVEKNIIGVKHGETVSVEHRYCVCVDTDNLGRLTGIEAIRGSELVAKVTTTAP